MLRQNVSDNLEILYLCLKCQEELFPSNVY